MDEVWQRAVEKRLDTHDRRFETHEGQMMDLSAKLDANTALTEVGNKDSQEIVQILRDWKGALSVFGFVTKKVLVPLGAAAGALALIWGALHGKIPSIF